MVATSNLTDEQQQAQDKAAQQFRSRVSRAGGKMLEMPVREGQDITTPAPTPQPEREPLRDRYEIADDQDDIVVTLKRRGGETVEITIPPVTTGALRALSWRLRRVVQAAQAVDECEDDTQIQALLDEVTRRDEQLTRVMIPNLPPGLLASLSTAAADQLRAITRQLSQEALHVDEQGNPKP